MHHPITRHGYPLLLVLVMSWFSVWLVGPVWEKHYGESWDDVAMDMVVADDGSIVLVGDSGHENNSDDMMVIKLDPGGRLIWQRFFGGESTERGNGVVSCRTGGYLALGSTRSLGNGGMDIVLVKMDEDGDFIWNRTYGTTFSDRGFCIIPTSRGGSAIVGESNNDVLLMGIDDEGRQLWNKTYGTFGDPLWNLNRGDYHGFLAPRSLTEVSGGGYLIVGGRPATGEIFAIRVDYEGSVIWSRILPSDQDRDFPYQAIEDRGFIIIGSSFKGGVSDALLVSIDLEGEQVWRKRIGKNGDLSEEAFSIVKLGDKFLGAGYAFVSEETSQDVDILLFEFRRDGKVTNAVTFGGEGWDQVSCMRVVGEDVLIVAGATTTQSSVYENKDMYVAKFALQAHNRFPSSIVVVGLIAMTFISSVCIKRRSRHIHGHG